MRAATVAIGSASWLLGATALAQTPGGTVQGGGASGPTTDVATNRFERGKPEESPAESKDATTLGLSAGGLVATGNSRSLAGTGSTRFRLRRSANQVSAAVAGNYARAAQDTSSRMETTVENVQGRLRYDRFLVEHLAVFLAVLARRDRFQGLDLRLRVDPGIAYYFLDDKAEQLWAEFGYDLQYDIRRRANLRAAAADGTELARTAVEHSLRTFLGYESKLNDSVAVNLGLEYLQSVERADAWRINWEAALTAKLTDRFSSATAVTVLHDQAPLPGVERTDAMMSFNLVYQLL